MKDYTWKHRRRHVAVIAGGIELSLAILAVTIATSIWIHRLMHWFDPC